MERGERHARREYSSTVQVRLSRLSHRQEREDRAKNMADRAPPALLAGVEARLRAEGDERRSAGARDDLQGRVGVAGKAGESDANRRLIVA